MRPYNFFDTFIHLCEGSLDEMSIEGRGRERFVEHEVREWEFCRNRWATGVRRPWPRELYGELV